MFNFFGEVKDPIFLIWKSNIKTIKSMNSHIVDFKGYVLNNRFISENDRNRLFKLVDDLLRKAFLSYKYGKLWLINCIKRTTAINEFDLELNEINENKKDVIVYVDIGARRKYLFSQKDFINIIKSNLENSYMFDHLPQPLPIRNPYTNREFHKLDFIEIDRMLIDSPLIWKMYRDCKYNLERFKLTNYNYLTIFSVGSYVDQLEKEDIVFYIEDIFMYYNFVTYCVKCVNDIESLKNRKLRGILMNWFLFQKRLGLFTQNDLNLLCEMFKINCLEHTQKDKPTVKYFDSSIINFEFTGGPIKDGFVFTAHANSSDEQKEITAGKSIDTTTDSNTTDSTKEITGFKMGKKIVKNKKSKRDNKKVLKKKVVIKTIS